MDWWKKALITVAVIWGAVIFILAVWVFPPRSGSWQRQLVPVVQESYEVNGDRIVIRSLNWGEAVIVSGLEATVEKDFTGQLPEILGQDESCFVLEVSGPTDGEIVLRARFAWVEGKTWWGATEAKIRAWSKNENCLGGVEVYRFK